jgi:hypothetical protein
VPHHFRIALTGAPLPDDCTPERYRGMFVVGSLIFHVFELS